MDKIRIKELYQGKIKLKDGTYALGIVTAWGSVWISRRNLSSFLSKNQHLADTFRNNMIFADELIGRYIYVTDKEAETYHNGVIFRSPKL